MLIKSFNHIVINILLFLFVKIKNYLLKELVVIAVNKWVNMPTILVYYNFTVWNNLLKRYILETSHPDPT